MPMLLVCNIHLFSLCAEKNNTQLEKNSEGAESPIAGGKQAGSVLCYRSSRAEKP